MFTEEEIKTAKATRDEIIRDDIEVLKGIYMAGEICMWDEMKSKRKVLLEALQAIAARIIGEYSDPSLMKRGALGDMESDILRYAKEALQSSTK